MKDWAKIAKAQGLDLPAQDADRIAKALAELERTMADHPADSEDE